MLFFVVFFILNYIDIQYYDGRISFIFWILLAGLKELITSIDNTPRLKEFYNTKTNEIKTSLTELNKTVKDKATQIKIQEVVKILPTIDKTSKVKDDDLINLLQYYDLIEELKTTNVPVQA